MGKANSQAKVNVQESKFWVRYARPILALALFLIAIHDVFGSHGLLAMRRTQSQIKQLRGEIERLNQENNDLNKQVQALRTDPKTVERIAREEMGLARPGEMIFKLPDEAPKSGEAKKAP